MHNELTEKLSVAIDNKNGRESSNFWKNFIKNNLEMIFDKLKKHYGIIPWKLIIALWNIENQNLIILERDWNNWINNIQKN